MIKLFADFNNADSHGRVRLNTQGSLDDIEKNGIQLREGLSVLLYADDDIDESGQPHELTASGVLSYSQQEKCWVAAIDWSDIEHVEHQDTLHPGVNGTTNGKPQLPKPSASMAK